MTEHLDYSRRAAGAALGARLRRLAERIDGDVGRAYTARGISFEQRWFGILNQIVVNGSVGIGDIAKSLRITHASVSQASSSLERAGYVCSSPDPADGRRSLLRLTPSGSLLVTELSPLWSALASAATQLNAEAGDVVRLLDQLEDALDHRSLAERVQDQLDLVACKRPTRPGHAGDSI